MKLATSTSTRRRLISKSLSNLFITTHVLKEGEIAGKSSNERYAAIEVEKEFLKTGKYDINYSTVTSCDADHKFHPKHFACLAFNTYFN